MKVILFMGYSDIKGPFKRGSSESRFLYRVFRAAFSMQQFHAVFPCRVVRKVLLTRGAVECYVLFDQEGG